jgi:chemotaxis protein methyltransferase CheR
MRDADCARFLRSALPALGLRWSGYRRVHRTLCKRLRRRLVELGLADLDAYRAQLAADPDERARLDALCRIPISRFWRDRAVFEALGGQVLGALAERCAGRAARELRAWSCGCASGEEPYSLRLLWRVEVQPRWPALGLRILATDVDAHLLARARAGCYPAGSLKELPPGLREGAFEQRNGRFCVRPELRTGVTFLRQDVRVEQPPGPFDLVLCRNLVFTYFDRAHQAALLERLVGRLRPGGCLVIGHSERLPVARPDLEPWAPDLPIFRAPDRASALP